MKVKSKYIRLNPDRRLYKLDIPVIGLTGGIASGKTTVGKMLMDKGFPLINADLLVKSIYSRQDVKDFIQKEHPDVMKNGEIQFPLLRQKVFLSREVKTQIEGLIYQHLFTAFRKEFEKFQDPKVLIYDVPLLFERNMESYFDLTVLVYAPRKIQRARLMTRDGHLEDMANNILDQQMDIEEKKAKAEFIIDNSQTETELTEELNQFLRQILE